jgi:hypothetical protein
MAISKDVLWKGIIESLIDHFIRFFFPAFAEEVDFDKGFDFLDTELQKLIPDNKSSKRHADKLIKLWLKIKSKPSLVSLPFTSTLKIRQ